jgi:peptidoglycan hydrolase-like protein with peptidoglycan-binding domain
MRLRKTTHLTLALLMAAGLGVSAASLPAQTAPQKKPSYNRPAAKAHRGKSAKTSTAKKSSRREKGQKAPTQERITEIQQALGKNGVYTANPSGKWDDQTVDAMRSFQQTHGLNPTGKLDAKTLQQLGLGSQTAGVAAPMLPAGSPSTTSRLTPTAIPTARGRQ